MQSKPAILIDNRVACIGPPLKTDHDIGLLRQQIGNFPFALIAPVGTNDCFYHRDSSSQKRTQASHTSSGSSAFQIQLIIILGFSRCKGARIKFHFFAKICLKIWDLSLYIHNLHC